MSFLNSDLPQGTLDLLILKMIDLEPVHGYGIAKRLEQVSSETLRVPQGSLYPALHRLENRGFVDAEWRAADSGREAKFYSLTRKGKAQLQEEIAGWLRLAEIVGIVIRLRKEGAQ